MSYLSVRKNQSADPSSVEKARMRDTSLFNQSNAAIHNIGDIKNVGDIIRGPDIDFTIGSNLGATGASGSGNSEQDAYAGMSCNDMTVDFEFERVAVNSLAFHFEDKTVFPGTGCYPNTIHRYWEIRRTDNQSVVYTYSSTNVDRKAIAILPELDKEYEVCLTVSIYCDFGFCSDEKCKTLFTTYTPPPPPPTPDECCIRRQSKKETIYSQNGDHKIKCKASFRNLFIWHGFFSSTIHYRKAGLLNNFRRRRADFVFSGFNGRYFEETNNSNCGKQVPPISEDPLKRPIDWKGRSNRRKMRTSYRTHWGFPRIHLKEGSMIYQFEARDKGQSMYNEIKLAQC